MARGWSIHNWRTYDNDYSFQAAVHLDSSHPPSMLARSVHNIWSSFHDLDHRFVGVLVLVQLPNVIRSDFLLERGVEDGDDTREPGGNVGDE
jgi:hypothetical protein